MNAGHAGKGEERRLATAFTVSVLLHLFVAALGLFGQYFAGLKRLEPKILDVSLVTLPGPGSPASEERGGGPSPVVDEVPAEVPEPVDEPVNEPQKPEKPTMPEPLPEPPQKKDAVKEAVKKVPEKPLDTKPEPKPKSPDERVKELEKSVGQRQPSELERTLARLQEQVKKGPPSDLYKRSGPGGIGGGRGEGAYGAPLTPYEQYLVSIATIIQRNWTFTPQLIRETSAVEAYVAMTIQPGGSISNVTFDRRSVSEYFDDTVLKAIERSSPLPPIPADVGSGAMRIGLVFTPRGIE
ncbi:hypothetical protein CHL67_07650 [Prosthecochloris sp. GSB1]|uniref:TonB family protein n=1 Tax=Prosthecochloris sp. GSB1 TaxID=281093 RepID=UPI000B8CB27E|nr:TonB family protein [Prosthecochloris sp. GSB1]ASQ90809.1 hypothetical protein CHL67_07650 [Prosthecochloris sp. GSB1]